MHEWEGRNVRVIGIRPNASLFIRVVLRGPVAPPGGARLRSGGPRFRTGGEHRPGGIWQQRAFQVLFRRTHRPGAEGADRSRPGPGRGGKRAALRSDSRRPCSLFSEERKPWKLLIKVQYYADDRHWSTHLGLGNRWGWTARIPDPERRPDLRGPVSSGVGRDRGWGGLRNNRRISAGASAPSAKTSPSFSFFLVGRGKNWASSDATR